MRRQALMVAALGLLLMQGALWSQETTVRIINLRYCPVQEMSRIVETIYGGDGTQFVVDENTNCLIVRATPERMEEIEHLVAQLDIKTESAPQGEPLLCRIYMVEVPSKQSDLRPFSIVLYPPARMDLSNLLKVSEDKQLEINAVKGHQHPESDGLLRFEIQGRAASTEKIKEMFALIPGGADIEAIKWDHETSACTVPAAQVSQLPERLRQHIHKFFGTEVQTMGYWFGNLSSPGQIEAPIGPWSIQLEVKPTQSTALAVEVSVGEWRGDAAYSILSNSIQGKVGKPIIIGYNREVNKARTMGAMIILMEPDVSP